MTKQAAIYQFFSNFGLPAYSSNSVPNDTTFPWLTYEQSFGNWEESLSITVSLWYHTESEAVPNAKVEEISKAIGLGGTTVPYDDGIIWIKRGSPWCITVPDAADSTTKVKELNITLEFL